MREDEMTLRERIALEILKELIRSGIRSASLVDLSFDLADQFLKRALRGQI